MTNKHHLKQEDVELFRRTMGDVLPINQESINLQKPRPRPRVRAAQQTAGPVEQTGSRDEFLADEFLVGAADIIEFRRPGLQERFYRKFKRGQLPVAEELDLHGLTLDKARMLLEDFMQATRHIERQRCIRIIHGKGYGSRDGRPVLKQYIQKWLQNYATVLAYSSCTAADGGTGAVYVLVKSGAAN